MTSTKYIGMDVHKESISIAVLDFAGLVQSLLVVTHPRFHQQRTDLDFHLHHLPDQQVAIAQRTPPFMDRRWHHVTLRQKIAGNQSHILSASMRSFFFFAAAMARSINGCATFSAAEVLLLLRQLSRKQYYPPQSCLQEETHSLVAHGRPLKGHAIE
jgi:hypothetical protein